MPSTFRWNICETNPWEFCVVYWTACTLPVTSINSGAHELPTVETSGVVVLVVDVVACAIGMAPAISSLTLTVDRLLP